MCLLMHTHTHTHTHTDGILPHISQMTHSTLKKPLSLQVVYLYYPLTL